MSLPVPLSNLILKVTLLCRLFVNLVKTDFHHNLLITQVVYPIVATSAVFLILDQRWILA